MKLEHNYISFNPLHRRPIKTFDNHNAKHLPHQFYDPHCASVTHPILVHCLVIAFSIGCCCLPRLALYRTRETVKPQAARCGFLLWLVPLALMQKSLRPAGDVFADGCGEKCARKAASEQPIEI